MRNRFDSFVRVTGFLLILRALVFLGSAIMIAFAHSMAKPSTINDVITPVVFTVMYSAFCMILSLRLSGAYLGSYGQLFRNRIDSLNYSKYKNGSEIANRRKENLEKGNVNSVEPDIKKLEEATKQKPFFMRPVTNVPSARTVLVLLVIDLVMTIVLMLALSELPKLFIGIIVEAFTIILAFLDVFDETAKSSN